MTDQLPIIRHSTPNHAYWCTFATQGWARDPGVKPCDPPPLDDYIGLPGSKIARETLDEQLVFGSGGWSADIPAAVRQDLYLMMDDGWDVPVGVHGDTQLWRFGSLEVDEGRFPSCTGTPGERLQALSRRTREAGWKGLGIWIACQGYGDGRDGVRLGDADLERFWRERLRWSREAEIPYWKVDWGVRCHEHPARQLISRLAREEAPGLLVEHAWCTRPLNAWPGNGRFAGDGPVRANMRDLVGYSDVVRAYDVFYALSSATMLDRAADLLAAVPSAGGQVILNLEDEVSMAATLGCSFGLLRHPQWRKVRGIELDPLDTSMRMTEAVRAVAWQHIAPVVPLGRTPVLVGGGLLTDAWDFRVGETWMVEIVGTRVEQHAPGILARGIALPEVEGQGAVPFVAASRHPDGAVAVATLARTAPRRPGIIPLAAITLHVDRLDRTPIGIFGEYASLTIRANAGSPCRRVRCQDLAGGPVLDITGQVEQLPMALRIPGELIHRLGTAMQPTGDRSHPGLVLWCD